MDPAEPPPLPEPQPARKGISTRTIVLLVVGSLVLVGGGVAAVGLFISSQVSTMQGRMTQILCQQNLAQIGALFVEEQAARPPAKPRSGQALLLGWRKDRRLIKGGSEDMLLCPHDPGVRQLVTEADRRSYDDIDLEDPPID